MKVVHRFCGVAVLGAALGSAPAAAQTAGKPATASSTQVDAARARYEKGRVHEKAGKLDLAYAEYAAAYKLYGHWQIAGTLGPVALKLRKYREAAERIALFLGQGQGVGLAERNEKLQQLAQATSKIGTLTFEVAPGSELFVDGKSVGRAPLAEDMYVDPGDHVIEAKKAGVSAKATVHVGAGKRQVVKLRYGGAEPVPGDVEVAPGPTATPAGTGGGTPAVTMSTSASGAAEKAPTSARSVVLGTGIALTVVGVAGGITTGALSLDRSSQRDANLADKDRWETLEDQRFLLSNTAGWFFIAAGVGLAATLGTVIFWPSQNKANAMIRVRSTGLGGDVSVTW